MATLGGLLQPAQVAFLAVVYISYQDPTVKYIPYSHVSYHRFLDMIERGWLKGEEKEDGSQYMGITRVGTLLLQQYTRTQWVMALVDQGYSTEALYYIGIMDKDELSELLVHKNGQFRRAAQRRYQDLGEE